MKTVIAAALGECVHVAGVMNFLRLAEAAGWRTVFLGPATPIEQVLAAAQRERADLVGVSYRLTPETGERLLGEFAEAADELRTRGMRFAFGGTPPLAERAAAMGFFERTFAGGEPADQVLAYLRGQAAGGQGEADYPQSIIERIAWKAPSSRSVPIRMHRRTSSTPSDRTPLARALGACRCALQPTCAPSSQPAGAATTHSCAPMPAPTISCSWPSSTWRPSTTPGAPCPSTGSTAWMAAGPGAWPNRSAPIRSS